MGQRAGRRVSRAQRYWAVAGLVAIVAVGAGLLWRAQVLRPSGGDGQTPARSARGGAPALARRETRPTLAPAMFVGKAALAHQVAREIPDVLDALYCYCECDKHLGHRSLLSCYTDGHAAT